MSRNEAAERLREVLGKHTTPSEWLDEALATERRLTVERLASVLHDSTCQWRPNRGFLAKTDREYHLNRAAILVSRLATADAKEDVRLPSENLLAEAMHSTRRPGHRSHALEECDTENPITLEAWAGRIHDWLNEVATPPPVPAAHPRTYSLTASGPNGELFLVTDDESGINIGYADKIGGPLTAAPLP